MQNYNSTLLKKTWTNTSNSKKDLQIFIVLFPPSTSGESQIHSMLNIEEAPTAFSFTLALLASTLPPFIVICIEQNRASIQPKKLQSNHIVHAPNVVQKRIVRMQIVDKHSQCRIGVKIITYAYGRESRTFRRYVYRFFVGDGFLYITYVEKRPLHISARWQVIRHRASACDCSSAKEC